MLDPNFVILGTIIGSVGGTAYLIYTIQGKVKPNRVTYLIWAIAPLIATVAQIQQGVGIQALMTFSIGFLPLLIFIASLFNKKAEWKVTKFDLICGALSIIGLLLWSITRVGNVAIVFAILADGLAALPTIVKSYKYPETESGWTYLTAAINSAFVLLTITAWDFAHYGIATYFLISSLIIFFLVQFKIGKKFHKA